MCNKIYQQITIYLFILIVQPITLIKLVPDKVVSATF
jgi:hypothetical protein